MNIAPPLWSNILRGLPPTPSMIPSTGSRDLDTIGINRMWFPLDYGCANLADARAYHERLAARGEGDES
jgi:hypothetical protein